ncbi:MAG: hypothetical protein QW515_05310, partial [Thermoplasmatales archaeon]
QLFNWAIKIGSNIVNNERMYDKKTGRDLLRLLIFDLRAEETPGHFLEKLSKRLMEYKTNTNIQADVGIHPEIMKRDWHADSFYYMKAAVLTGFLNVLSSAKNTEEGDEKNES